MILGAQTSNETCRNMRTCLLKKDYWLNLVIFETRLHTFMKNKYTKEVVQNDKTRLSSRLKPFETHMTIRGNKYPYFSF